MSNKLLLTLNTSIFFTFLLTAFSSQAGNLGGVFGPKINPTDRSVQYRYALAPSDNGTDDNWGHRLHYQQALNTDYRLRGVVQYRDNQAGHEFDQARFEIHWQYQNSKNDAGNWDSALRLDFVARDEDRPHDIGLNWTNQWQLSDNLSAKAVLLTVIQVGDNEADGILLSSRYSLTYNTSNGLGLSLESYNTHGSTDDLAGFDETPQQIGPSISGKIGGLSYKAGYLFGLNDVTPDDTFTLWFTHKL